MMEDNKLWWAVINISMVICTVLWTEIIFDRNQIHQMFYLTEPFCLMSNVRAPFPPKTNPHSWFLWFFNSKEEKKLTKCQCQNIHSDKFQDGKHSKVHQSPMSFEEKHVSLSFDSRISWAYVCDGLSMRQHFSPHYSKHFWAWFLSLWSFCFSFHVCGIKNLTAIYLQFEQMSKDVRQHETIAMVIKKDSWLFPSC